MGCGRWEVGRGQCRRAEMDCKENILQDGENFSLLCFALMLISVQLQDDPGLVFARAGS